jgi:hypothetical protein
LLQADAGQFEAEWLRNASGIIDGALDVERDGVRYGNADSHGVFSRMRFKKTRSGATRGRERCSAGLAALRCCGF